MRLDGVRQMVMTTGTAATPDRGARHLARCVRGGPGRRARPADPGAVRAARATSPPSAELHDAGATAIGIHVESLDDAVRRGGCRARPPCRWPSTGRRGARRCGCSAATGCRPTCWSAWARTPTSWWPARPRSIDRGRLPVRRARSARWPAPWPPPTASPPPDPALLADVTRRVADVLRRAGMRGADQDAGCAACGACSALPRRAGEPDVGIDELLGRTSSVAGARPPRGRGPAGGCAVRRGGRDADRGGARHRRAAPRACSSTSRASSPAPTATTSTTTPAPSCSWPAPPTAQVLGGVRLRPRAAGPADVGWWRGSRLVVDPDARAGARAAALVRAACARAEAAGALRFDATVQADKRARSSPGSAGTRAGRWHARTAGRTSLMRWPLEPASQRWPATKAPLGRRCSAGLRPGRRRVRRRRRRARCPAPTWSPPATPSCPSMVERDPEWAGWCAVLVNVNDLAAMGAAPVGLLDAVGARDPLVRPPRPGRADARPPSA